MFFWGRGIYLMQQQIPARAYCIIAGEFCPPHEKILHSCWRNGPAISLGARRTILHPPTHLHLHLPKLLTILYISFKMTICDKLRASASYFCGHSCSVQPLGNRLQMVNQV